MKPADITFDFFRFFSFLFYSFLLFFIFNFQFLFYFFIFSPVLLPKAKYNRKDGY